MRFMKRVRLFKIKSFGSTIVASLVITTIFVLFALAYERINHWLWLTILITLSVVAFILVLLYAKPIKNFKSKGFCYVDLYFLSLSIAFVAFGVICLPFFGALFHVNADKKWFPTNFSFASSFVCASLFITRIIYVHCHDKKQKNKYYLHDFVNGTLPEEVEGIIICDEAVETVEQDLFGRNGLIEEIASSLLRINGNDKTVIGLTGKWGVGKTTYLNFALNKVKGSLGKKAIICNTFSAWRYSDEKTFLVAAIREIYKHLQIGATYAEVSSAILKYANVFVKSDRLSLIEKISYGLSDEYETVICAINEYLVGNDIHFYFVIDNIDRANPEQIKFIYRAIVDILKIKNITYICLYDEANLDGVYQSRSFLDKVVSLKTPIEGPSKEKIFNVGYRAIKNYFSRSKNKLDIDKASKTDLDLLKKTLVQIDNLRTLILVLNRLFNYLSISDPRLNYFDLLAICTMKEINYGLFNYIINNRVYFVLAHREYLIETFHKDMMDGDNKQGKKQDFIKNNFEKEKDYQQYKDWLNALFPHSLEIYASISKEEIKKASVEGRIYSAKYFYDYISDNDYDYLGLTSQIKKAVLCSNSYDELDSSISEIFSSHLEADYEEVIKIITDVVDQEKNIENNHYVWLYKFFEKEYFNLSDVTMFLALSSRSRCGVLIDKLLIMMNQKNATKEISKYKKKPEYLKLLNDIEYWNEASIKNDDIGRSLSDLINTTLLEIISDILAKSLDVLTKKYYTRGIIWCIKNRTEASTFRTFINSILTPNNVFCLLNDCVGTGKRLDGDSRKYVLSLGKETIEKLIPLNELKAIVDKSAIKTEADEVLCKMFNNLITSEKNEVEEYFEEPPSFINNFFNK